MRNRTPSAWQCSTSSRANRFASPDSSCAVYVAPASFGATWRSAGSIARASSTVIKRRSQPERAHLRGGPLGGRELCGARVEVQDALRALVVVDADVAAQLLQHLAAVGAEPHDVLDVAAACAPACIRARTRASRAIDANRRAAGTTAARLPASSTSAPSAARSGSPTAPRGSRRSGRRSRSSSRRPASLGDRRP